MKTQEQKMAEAVLNYRMSQLTAYLEVVKTIAYIKETKHIDKLSFDKSDKLFWSSFETDENGIGSVMPIVGLDAKDIDLLITILLPNGETETFVPEIYEIDLMKIGNAIASSLK